MISELRAKVVDFGLEPGFRGPHPRRAFARCLHASLDSGHHFRREGGVPEPFPARKKKLIQGFLPGHLPHFCHKILVWVFVRGLARAARALVFLLVLAELALQLLVFFAELPLLAGDHRRKGSSANGLSRPGALTSEEA